MADLPDNVRQSFESAMAKLLPKKSMKKYENAFDHFQKYQKEKGIEGKFDEPFLMAYFFDNNGKWNPKTMWSRYSMIKKVLIRDHNIDIGKYKRLTSYLGNNAKGFKSKQSARLLPDHIKRFILEAPDDEFLFTKVSFLFNLCFVFIHFI